MAYESGPRDRRSDLARTAVAEGVAAAIGQAVLRLRVFRGWRQIDLEHLTGIDQTTISRLERGRGGGLSVRRLALLLGGLGVGDVEFRPADPSPKHAPLSETDQILRADRWLRAARYAQQRLRRPTRTRTTISTRPPSETATADEE